MKKTVYIETSIPSYLTARPSRDIRVAAWQQITAQWWDEARAHDELCTSELVIVEASAGNPEAARRRVEALQGMAELPVDQEGQTLAGRLIAQGGVPAGAEAEALHIAVAAVHRMDYLLTWNFRHIANAVTKPLIRSICAEAGYSCPEMCAPVELLPEGENDV